MGAWSNWLTRQSLKLLRRKAYEGSNPSAPTILIYQEDARHESTSGAFAVYPYGIWIRSMRESDSGRIAARISP